MTVRERYSHKIADDKRKRKHQQVDKVFRKKLHRLAMIANKYRLVKLHSTKTDLKSFQYLFLMKVETYYE